MALTAHERLRQAAMALALLAHDNIPLTASMINSSVHAGRLAMEALPSYSLLHAGLVLVGLCGPT